MLKKLALLGIGCAMFMGIQTSFVHARSYVLEPVPDVDLGPNVDTSKAVEVPHGGTYSFSIGPGGSYSADHTCTAKWPADKTMYNMTITAPTPVTIEVIDCCIMGDTICLGQSASKKICAKSPATAKYTNPSLAAGTYQFGVAYSDCPGGFPAGYTIKVNGK